MKEFSLFLDESGKFEGNSKNLPSMVGGLMQEGRGYSENEAKNIMATIKNSNPNFESISIDPFHGIKERSPHVGEFVTMVMGQLVKNGGRLVNIKSQRSYLIVNSDITYLNVFSEGIVNLAQSLQASTQDSILLNIYYAHRQNMLENKHTGQKIRLKQSEYDIRLNEKIVQRCRMMSPDVRKRITIHMSTDNAEKSYRLMLADLICFGLRGGRRKLSTEQKERIHQLSPMEFKVEEQGLWNLVRDLLSDGRLGEAMYSWYLNSKTAASTDHERDFKDILLYRIKGIPEKSLVIQFKIFSQLLQDLISRREFALALGVTKTLRAQFFPWLEKEHLHAAEFEFDCYFNEFTVATHLGMDKLEQEDLSMCQKALKALPPSFERIDYYLNYKLREIEYQKNCFDFVGAIENLNKLEGILVNLVDLTKMIDELSEFGEDIHSSTLGKVLGSRVSVITFQLGSEVLNSNEKKDLLTKARNDSQRSAENFTGEDDLSRHAQTRCALEYSAGNWQEAYSWLAKSIAQPIEIHAKDLLSCMIGIDGLNIFGIYHYANLMGLSANAGNDIGQAMYDAFEQANILGQLKEGLPHPHYTIAWRAAQCMAVFGRLKAAEATYEHALKSALSNPSNFTIYAEGLGIEADMLATMRPDKMKAALQRLRKDYETLVKYNIPQPAMRIFDPWPEMISGLESAKKEEQIQVLQRLSRSVPML